MNKLKLGSDFTEGEHADGSEGEEAEKTPPEEGTEEEKDNSGDTADTKTPEESADDDSSDEDATEDPKDPAETPDKSAKERELQGLLETEKSIDGDLSSIEEQIKQAKIRISQKRRSRRDGRELAENIDTVIPPEEESNDDLSDVDPDTLKLLERFTKAKGLVPKSELTQMSYQSAHKTAEDSFYASHPEYLPENDTDDSLYNALKSELKLFAKPEDPKLIGAIFEKAHLQVQKTYPDKFKTQPPAKKTLNNNTGSAAARVSKQQLGGGSGGSSAPAPSKGGEGKKSFTEQQVRALQDGGWSEDEIRALIGS